MTEQFNLDPRLSISLSHLLEDSNMGRHPAASVRAVGTMGDGQAHLAEEQVTVVVEAERSDDVARQAEQEGMGTERLSSSILAVTLRLSQLRRLVAMKGVERASAQPKKEYYLESASQEMELVSVAGGARQVVEDGAGVVVAIVDSGFDLSHPTFRDAAGNLRVDALLDQTTNTEYTRQQLETAWAGGANPGADLVGHGTHVASIAAGSAHQGWEGVAPKARFLLVKTDMRRTAQAIVWAFNRAGAKPCVANMSLGHHGGGHDGQDSEERLYTSIAGPGRLIVVAAGNEREQLIHLGGRFSSGQTHTAVVDLQRQNGEPAGALIHFWCAPTDDFSINLLSPDGQTVAMPTLNNTTRNSTSRWDASVSFRRHPYSGHQITVEISMANASVPPGLLRGWEVRIVCQNAVVGRLDGWFGNSRYGNFRQDSLVEKARTLGMPATSDGVITVASHVSKERWASDAGPQTKAGLVLGRSSSFSGMGPTRDGRQKPEVSAPGEMITAALASGSEYGSDAERSNAFLRSLTIEGTSMASPMFCGVVALALQKRPGLTPALLRTVLQQSALRDGHTGLGNWDPQYGYGKVRVPALLAAV